MFYQTDDFVVIVLDKRIKVYSKCSWAVAFDLHFNEDIAQIFAKNDYLYVVSLNCSLFEILLGYDQYGRQIINCYDLIQSCVDGRLVQVAVLPRTSSKMLVQRV